MLSSARDQRPLLSELPSLSVELEGATGTTLHELRAEHPLALIGRGAQSDLRLEDVEVSRRHALLVRWGQGIFCTDLGSRGGTRFDSGAVGYGWLVPSVTIAIGPYRLRPAPGVVGNPRDLALHRDLLPFDRAHDWQLKFVSGEVQPTAYTLRRPLTLIGRKAPCKIQFKLSGVQSVHAALLVTPDGLYLRDLSGRCALRVDGQSWLGGWLRDGQLVELGEVQVRVVQVAPVMAGRLPDAETDDPAGGVTQESMAPFLLTSPRTADAAELSPPLTQPILSGRYQVVRRLARGGMGVVYEGLDVRLHRTVAIKVVRGKGSASNLGRQRLLREAMVGARLDHPHIVRVLDADREGRYAVFEFVSGVTLGERLRKNGPLPPTRPGWRVAGRRHASRHGVVHRDIKPANVLVTRRT
jgi:pSer/pThr/pTyr-binding forkhead associated (FHA) protein